MRFSLDWLREFVDIDLAPESGGPAAPGPSSGPGGAADGSASGHGGPAADLAKRLTLSGFAVEGIETFTPPSDPLGPPDTVFEVEVTSNRPDALNHLGLAREIASVLDRPLREPSVTLAQDPSPAEGTASIAIEAGDLCPRYVGRVVSGVRIADSPLWMKRRLEAAGLAPKNNVVDASNYVLLELGQPLHAFDLARLDGRGVLVRRARAGERIVTVVDRADRTLADGMLVIAHAGGAGRASRPAAIAGVMGGFETAISDQTTEVLIESAWFDPLSVRRTARALDLHTDASHRFERGADPAMTRFAADRLAALIVEVAGGRVLRGAIDVRAGGAGASIPFADVLAGAPAGDRVPLPAVRREPPIVLRSERIESLLGLEIDPAEVPSVLARVGVSVVDSPRIVAKGAPVTPPSAGGRSASTVDRGLASGSPGGTAATNRASRGVTAAAAGAGQGPSRERAPRTFDCRAPSWRWDLTREADLIEEYARLTGYERVPETLPEGPGPLPSPSAHDLEDRARDLLVSFGYAEAITYAMISAADDTLFGALDSPGAFTERSAFVITNPLSERWEAMRRSLLPGLARVLAFNVARGRTDLRMFEVATVHYRDEQGLPVERLAAAIGATGLAADPVWPTPARLYDVLDLRGAIEALAIGLVGAPASAYAGGGTHSPFVEALPAPSPERGGGVWPLHPGQSFRIIGAGVPAGRGGRLHPEVEAALECDRPLFLAEILLEPFGRLRKTPRFKPLERLNPVERDLSFFVPKNLSYSEIVRAVSQAVAAAPAADAGAPVFFLLDRFEGRSTPAANHVSYAFRFRFTPRERQLTAEEMNASIEEIARRLTSSIGAEIRSR